MWLFLTLPSRHQTVNKQYNQTERKMRVVPVLYILWLFERKPIGMVAEHRSWKIHKQLLVLSCAAWAAVSHILSITNVHRSVPWRQRKERIYCEVKSGWRLCTVERDSQRDKGSTTVTVSAGTVPSGQRHSGVLLKRESSDWWLHKTHCT